MGVSGRWARGGCSVCGVGGCGRGIGRGGLRGCWAGALSVVSARRRWMGARGCFGGGKVATRWDEVAAISREMQEFEYYAV